MIITFMTNILDNQILGAIFPNLNSITGIIKKQISDILGKKLNNISILHNLMANLKLNILKSLVIYKN